MNHKDRNLISPEARRKFLKSLGTSGLAWLGAEAFLTCAPAGLARQARPQSEPAAMSPNEDLMQEHALLSRVLLVYEEAGRRLRENLALNPDLLKRSAGIIQHFVEQYHEKLEEDYVFPRFEKAGKLLELVKVLLQQHKTGRLLTQEIVSSAAPRVFNDPAGRKRLERLLSSFIRMYRPHAAREGSMLFPSFRDLLPAQEFESLGDLFEKKEHELLGAEGFEGQVQRVAEIEKQIGLFDLAQYTPPGIA